MIRPKANSFTLVEMIGAMAILAILASVLAPSVVRQVQTATSVGEDANLADIAQALTNAIRTTGLIPNPNLEPSATNATGGFGWAYLASNYTRLAGSNLVYVFPGMTNETGRRLYLSTNLVALAAQGGFANTVSNWGATLFPTNAKMYLVSASRPEFNLLLPANGAGAQTTNNTNAATLVQSLASWVKQFSNGVTVAPAAIVSWTNRGEFLHVRSIDLAPIFSEAKLAQQKAIEQEDKNLEEIARALVAAIQATGQLPNPNVVCTSAGGWLQLAAPYSSLGQDSFQFSFPGTASSERRVYLETSLAAAPLVTPAGGWPAMPASPACLYIVSSSKKDLGLRCLQNGVGANADVAGDFNWLRSWTKAAGSDGLITATNTIVNNAWTNRGEFLHVKVVDLRPLFCRVELTDFASPITARVSSAADGYTLTGVIASQSGYYFSFPSSPGNPRQLTVGTTGTLVNSSKQLLVRPGPPSPADIYDQPQVNPPAKFTIDMPSSPYWVITPPGLSGSGNSMPAASNTSAFYVIKGTSLSLYSTTAPPPAAPILTVQINSDSAFEYFNGSWTRVD